MESGGRKAPPPERFFEDTHFWQQRIILAACKLDVFTQVASGPRSAADVARNLDSDPRSTEVLLDALVAVEYLVKKKGVYANAPIATQYLVRDAPEYLGHFALLDHDSWALWGTLADTVRTGRNAPLAKLYREDRGRTYHLLMGLHLMGRKEAPRLARKLKLAGARKLLDLGGGLGTYSIAFCRAYPKLRATIFDLPMAKEFSRLILQESGVADRIEFDVGDCLTDEIGGHYDVVFVSNLLHGLPPESCEAVVAKAARALNPGGRIVVHEWILDEDRVRPVEAATFSTLLMLENAGARCYTLSEIRRWLTDAGFRQPKEIARGAVVAAVKGRAAS